MARIHLRTWGCSHNTADSERMAGLLTAAGHEIVDEKTAELIILNSCAVKSPSEEKFRHEVRRLAKTKKLVLAGCVPHANRRDPELLNYSAVGTNDLESILDVVEATLDGKVKRLFSTKRSRLLLPILRKNPLIAIIPIADGCLGTCTYCATVRARGRLSSHPIPAIVEAIEHAVEEGCKEIWLTAEDVGAYGKDLKTRLVELLQAIATIRGAFMVRIGMANPEHIAPIIDELLGILEAHPERFYRFLHLPVQSGDDAVLTHMGRPYTAQLFRELVATIRRRLPECTIATDIIVGYPTETAEAFARTEALVRETALPIVNITKFYPRPGTRAARLKLLPTAIVARRTRELVALFESYDPNTQYQGKRVRALFTERNETAGKEAVIGHLQNYRQILIPRTSANEKIKLGTWIEVTIIDEKKYYLTAQPISGKTKSTYRKSAEKEPKK